MTANSLPRFVSLATGLLCLSMAACKSTKKSDYSGVVDYTTPDTKLSQEEYPFDEKGNYLADVVSGKKKGSRNKAIDPPKSFVDTYEKPPEPTVAAVPNYETPPVSDPYAPVYSSGNGGSGSTSSTRKPSTSSSSAPASKPKTSTAAKAKPKPKTVAKAKPKPKPKTSSLSYTVKKGDTLYGLASRYNTSVAAIKKASGLSSDMLRDGRTIKIPRK